jgi:hypothetical protein
MDDQRTDRESGGSVSDPIKLMGQKTYTRLVEHLTSYDRMLAEFKAKHAQAVVANDATAVSKYLRAIGYHLISSVKVAE